MSEKGSLLIAIDGPAGAGKSTVARLLSHRLGIPILDTGAMYRALAVASQRSGIDPHDETALSELGKRIKIDFQGDDRRIVILNGQDVSEAIRTLEIGQLASTISALSAVRRVLVQLQQAVIEGQNFVLEGRDTTTVVAPDADLKIFLTASIEERARRRWLELGQRGLEDSLQRVVVDVVQRDHRDYSRKDSPLQLAEDAEIIETYGVTPPEIVTKILLMLKDRQLIQPWIDG